MGKEFIVEIKSQGGDPAAADVRKVEAATVDTTEAVKALTAAFAEETAALQQLEAQATAAEAPLRRIGTSGNGTPFDAVEAARARRGAAGPDTASAGQLEEIAQLEERIRALDAAAAGADGTGALLSGTLGALATGAAIGAGGLIKIVTALEGAHAETARADRAWERFQETLRVEIATQPVAALGTITRSFEQLQEKVAEFQNKGFLARALSIPGHVTGFGGALTDAKRAADESEKLRSNAQEAARATADRAAFEARIAEAQGEGNTELAERLKSQLAFSDEVKAMEPALKLLGETERDAVIRSIEARTIAQDAAKEKIKLRAEEAADRDQQNRDDIEAEKQKQAEKRSFLEQAAKDTEDFEKQKARENAEFDREKQRQAEQREKQNERDRQAELDAIDYFNSYWEAEAKATAKRIADARVDAEKQAQQEIAAFNQAFDAAKAGLGETPQQRSDRRQAEARDRQAERIVKGKELAELEKDPAFQRLAPEDRRLERERVGREIDRKRAGLGPEELMLPDGQMRGNVTRADDASQPRLDLPRSTPNANIGDRNYSGAQQPGSFDFFNLNGKTGGDAAAAMEPATTAAQGLTAATEAGAQQIASSLDAAQAALSALPGHFAAFAARLAAVEAAIAAQASE